MFWLKFDNPFPSSILADRIKIRRRYLVGLVHHVKFFYFQNFIWSINSRRFSTSHGNRMQLLARHFVIRTWTKIVSIYLLAVGESSTTTRPRSHFNGQRERARDENSTLQRPIRISQSNNMTSFPPSLSLILAATLGNLILDEKLLNRADIRESTRQ